MGYQLWLKENLKNIAETKGFSLINGRTHINSEKDTLIEIPNLDEFLDFHVHVENKLLFYSYSYDPKENYIIPDEYHQKYEKEIQEQVSQKINEYNKIIDKIDFDKPSAVFMYYIKEGFLFFNVTEREEIVDLLEYEDMVDVILEEVVQETPEEMLEEIKSQRKNKIDKEVNELKEIIFDDPKFKNATNASLRKVYSSQFFEENREYIELLRHADYYHPSIFIEDIWREFKQKGLHK
ncbi:hypothetical protein F8160_02490 [Bacillus sp. CH126_4D]|uniref:hypothetical protein n=1 Tax=unclassified Bacillus (in: firmicutes) TaxID=185979 RepID=UPI00124F3F88|nr:MULTISPECIES: hypothetical protein [unclassified Bacillus (in: firmicutes)]KAB2460964.1 hypothetical protein F8162_00415 [Bacillus sp. CH140a_4T]KAB2475046.1 hypothetical protein F8160_02490 [Bacillus sp. CH126_4D]